MNEPKEDRPTALVTGAGVRVGRAIAEELASAGYRVWLHAWRSFDAAEALADRLGGSAFAADLSQVNGPATLAAALPAGPLRLLVFSAGIYSRRRFVNVDVDDLEKMWAMHVRAPFLLTQALLPRLRPGGSVVFVTDASVARRSRRDDAISHYLPSKAALESLARTLAVELAPEVRVNAVAPGAVVFADFEDAEDRAAALARVPLGREGDPRDVARAVRFCAESPYVTGQVIQVDGGLSVG